jgi:RND superfamily putative drug exporter
VTPFDRLGRFVVRRAWWIIGAWVTLLLVAIPLAQQVPGQLSAGGFILDDLESARAKTLLESELGVPPSALVIVFSSPTPSVPSVTSTTAAAKVVPNSIPTTPNATAPITK